MKLRFIKIQFKNINSYGNHWTRIDLDQGDSVAIIGKNGGGKCLDPSTKIDIQIDDPEILKQFESFMKARSISSI